MGSIYELEQVYDKLKDDKVDLHTKFSYSHQIKTKGKNIRLSLGRIWFNLLLPDDYPLIDEPVTKKKMNSIINDLVEKYGPEKTSECISKLQEEAFKLTTIVPSSFTIDCLIIPPELEKKKEELKKKAKNMDIEEFQKEAQKLAEEFTEWVRKNGYSIQDVMDGGIKGDPVGEWRNLLISKGFVTDIEGNILGPIPYGITDGYTPTDYYSAAAEARKNFWYKSTLTADPGYLARKIITSTSHVEINKKDCGTKKYYELKVTKDNYNRIKYRYYVGRNGKLSLIKEPEKLIGKTIKLRSPLYCKDKDGICEICYGDGFKLHETKKIGILAGTAMNNILLNTLMKLRHKPSTIEIVKVNFKKILEESKYDPREISKFLEPFETYLVANNDIVITIDKQEYDNENLIITPEYIVIPGIIDVKLENDNDGRIKPITLPFNFDVKLILPENYEETRYEFILRYKKGEKIMEKDYYQKEVNIRLIDRMINGRIKYIQDPELLVNILANEIKSSDLIHIETIIQNIFRDADDPTKPARLNGYKNPAIYSHKQLPYFNWLSGLSFENIDKAIQSGLVSQKDAKLSAIDRVIIEHHNTE